MVRCARAALFADRGRTTSRRPSSRSLKIAFFTYNIRNSAALQYKVHAESRSFSQSVHHTSRSPRESATFTIHIMANSTLLTSEPSTELSTSPMSKSPLLSLPAELRNRIWEYAVQQPQPIEIARRSISYKLSMSRCMKKPEELRVAALVKVCHQTHNECSQMLYALNTFLFTIHPGPHVRTQHDHTWIYGRFLDTIGAPQKASLRRIQVNVKLPANFLFCQQTHDYLTALHERSAGIPLQSLRCTIMDPPSPRSLEIDVLDLTRSRANATGLRNTPSVFDTHIPFRAILELERSVLRQTTYEKIKQETHQQDINDMVEQDNYLQSCTAVLEAQTRQAPAHSANRRPRQYRVRDAPREHARYGRRAISSRDKQARYQAPYHQRTPNKWRPRGSRY